MLSELEIQLETERATLFRGGKDAVILIVSKLIAAQNQIKEELPFVNDGEQSAHMKAAYRAIGDITRIMENWINAGMPDKREIKSYIESP